MIHPSYASRPYKYAWCLSSPGTSQVSPVQGLIKVDAEAGEVVQKWIPESYEYLAEVIFVPRSEKEEDGYLIGYLMNGNEKRTSLAIFDAANVAQGPISKTELKGTFLSHLLHGTFVPGFTPSMDDTVKASFAKN
jgi:carotenoid cleavage dioxygenase-like enzyme